MGKYLVLGRDAAGDWYKRAQTFLADNNCHPLELTISDSDPTENEFIKAATALVSNTGDTIEIDPQASIFVVKVQDKGVQRRMNKCACQCGMSGSCGGGGGGH